MNMFKSVSEIIEIIQSGKKAVCSKAALSGVFVIEAYNKGEDALLCCSTTAESVYARLSQEQFDDLKDATDLGTCGAENQYDEKIIKSARNWVLENFNGDFYRVGKQQKLIKTKFSL